MPDNDTNAVALPTDDQMDMYKDIALAKDIRRAARFVAIVNQEYLQSKQETDKCANRLIQANAALQQLISQLA